jgi:selenocysteine lyase/cysteine desulfurase
VADAVHRFLTDVGATPGRGGHRLAKEAGRVALRCRKALGRILGVSGDPSRLILLLNATQGINVALRGVLREGDVVVTTAYDHNAVLRPLEALRRRRGVVCRQVSGNPSGTLDLIELEEALQGARLLVVNAVSNVLGTRLPLSAMAGLARDAGALVLVDAAQWAGHFADSLGEAGADLIAFTGHKALLGPQGIGGLWVKRGVEMDPFISGGTGGDSLNREMPNALPDRFEAGSANAPGMAGLLAGIEFLEGEGVENLRRHEMRLKHVLWEGLSGLRGIRVLSPPGPDGVGIVSVVPQAMRPAELADALDQHWGVMVRYGLNCAPEVHRMLGTQEDGVVRLSLGWCSTLRDVDQALRGVDAITSGPLIPGF